MFRPGKWAGILLLLAWGVIPLAARDLTEAADPSGPGPDVVKPVAKPAAEPTEWVTIEWVESADARGYVVEIRDEAGKSVQIERSKTNSVRFKLPVGRYEQRVGALNIFSKVGIWTDWKPLSVLKPVPPKIDNVKSEPPNAESKTREVVVSGGNFFENTKVTLVQDGKESIVENTKTDGSTLTFVLDRDRFPPGKATIKIENPGRKTEQADVELPSGPGEPEQRQDNGRSGGAQKLGFPPYMALVPGMSGFYRGAPVQGSIWAFAFIGLGTAYAKEHFAADNAAKSLESDPNRIIFENPLVYANFPDRVSLLNVAMFHYTQTSALRKSYAAHDSNRKVVAGAAAALLIAHLHTEIPFHAAYLAPGLAQFQNGNKWTGSALMGSSVIFAASLFSHYTAAERISSSTKNEIGYGLLTSGKTFAFVYSQVGASRDFYNFLYVRNLASKEMRSSHDQHVTMQVAAGVLLYATYVFAMLDAQSLRSTAVREPGSTSVSVMVLPEIKAGERKSGVVGEARLSIVLP